MAPRASKTRSETLIALDLLRFACAGCVVVLHLSTLLPLSPAARSIPRAGWIGVELFFVLSGMVIAWSAEGSAPGTFLKRRALRLLPAAWLCASVTAVALLAAGGVAESSILHRWLTSVAFAPVGRPIDPSYWTLAIEVNFYLAVAVLLRRGATAARIEQFAVMLGCASLTYWIAWLVVDVLPMQNRFTQLTLLPHGCFFALGMLIDAHLRRGATRERSVLMAMLTASASIEIVSHYREFTPDPVMLCVAYAIFAAGLLVLLRADRLQPWLARRVSQRVAVALGLATYPLYLIHNQVGRVIVPAVVAAGWSAWAGVGVTIALSLATAWIVSAHGEPRLRARLTAGGTRLSRLRARVPGTSPSASPSAG